MRIEFDDAKDAINRDKHGISLAAAAEMDFETAKVIADERRDYGEPRYWAIGSIAAGCISWPSRCAGRRCGRSRAEGQCEGEKRHEPA